ncbi:DUF3397 domain-containing protein [Virgibacillus sp. YIM 98842]|uniref:DUF3397 domain-containing protein n=1 Tax=Virgibacillus sp. YIM 98842 TaxID=2663533 RepID=UPI0013D9F297|nr:DUF3397 domain-containing protein [Virgibacillus sp. YIM 98842]
MVDIISYIIAFIITVPFIATWLVYFVLVKWNWPKLKAFHQAVNWTTLPYIIAVLILIRLNFDVNLTGVFIIFFLAALAFIIFMQWKMNMEILLTKALKLLWRILFLLFVFIYICLLVFEISYRIFY